jgi:hypothetical protein
MALFYAMPARRAWAFPPRMAAFPIKFIHKAGSRAAIEGNSLKKKRFFCRPACGQAVENHMPRYSPTRSRGRAARASAFRSCAYM